MHDTNSRGANAALGALALAIAGLISHPAVAEAPLEPLPAYESFAGPLLATYCGDCHAGDDAESGLAVDRLQGGDDFQQDRERWLDVVRRLRAGDMPPEEMPQPAAAEREDLIAWLQTRLDQVDCTGELEPGRVPLRRLNREQYRNTIRDLLGVDFAVAELFPPDELAYGFDNNANVLSLSPALVEKYLTAAEQIAEQAVPAPENLPDQGAPMALSQGPGVGVHDGGAGRRLYTRATATAQFTPPESGQYALCAVVAGEQAGDEPVRMSLQSGGRQVLECDVCADADEFDHFTVLVDLAAGATVEMGVAFLNDYYNPQAGDPAARDRNLIVHSLSVTGPHHFTEQAPAATRDNLLKETPAPEQWQSGAGWREIAAGQWREFLPLAWRRPVEPGEVDRLLQILEQVRHDGGSYQRAMQVALQAVLVSPRFLLLGNVPAGTPPGKVIQVDEFELASRLSYFLWGSTPDRTLLQLAAAGRLRSELDVQVPRMLHDERAKHLATSFAGQWLETRQLQTLSPDPQIFPEFDEGLRAAMRQETEEFASEIVRNDLPIRTFLDADFTYLNERLARHYGIEGVAGAEFRRVTLDEEQRNQGRGGVLGLASALAVSSHPNRTSPVVRGKYILANLLGDEPPPPPPNVPPLPEHDPSQPAGTLRERLEAHRSQPGCASCHVNMDPLGFALERFDALGRLRDSDAGQPIDDQGSLPDGTEFQGPVGLRSLLLDRFDDFRTALTEKLLTFALGRGLEHYDHCTVEQIAAATAQGDDRFSALTLAIVKSTPFQYARSPGAAEEESH